MNTAPLYLDHGIDELADQLEELFPLFFSWDDQARRSAVDHALDHDSGDPASVRRNGQVTAELSRRAEHTTPIYVEDTQGLIPYWYVVHVRTQPYSRGEPWHISEGDSYFDSARSQLAFQWVQPHEMPASTLMVFIALLDAHVHEQRQKARRLRALAMELSGLRAQS